METHRCTISPHVGGTRQLRCRRYAGDGALEMEVGGGGVDR